MYDPGLFQLLDGKRQRAPRTRPRSSALRSTFSSWDALLDASLRLADAVEAVEVRPRQPPLTEGRQLKKKSNCSRDSRAMVNNIYKFRRIKWADPKPKLKVLTEDIRRTLWIDRISNWKFAALVMFVALAVFLTVVAAAELLV